MSRTLDSAKLEEFAACSKVVAEGDYEVTSRFRRHVCL